MRRVSLKLSEAEYEAIVKEAKETEQSINNVIRDIIIRAFGPHPAGAEAGD